MVYGPAQVLLRRLEKSDSAAQTGDSEEMLLECDLLILDDLGTEFASPFTTSCLYNIVNTRLLEARPTIVSTNPPAAGAAGAVRTADRFPDGRFLQNPAVHGTGYPATAGGGKAAGRLTGRQGAAGGGKKSKRVELVKAL